MSNEKIAIDATTEATTEANNLLSVAKVYVIDCVEMAECAADDLTSIKSKLKELEETRKSITRPMDEAKQKVMDLFSKPQKILSDAEDHLKRALTGWNQKERLRLEQERKEAEEQQRIATAEAKRVADEAKKLADELAAADLPADIVHEAAIEAEDAQKTAEAMQYMAPVAAAQKKLSGISSRETWKAEVTDLMSLVKAVAAGQASIDLLQPADTVINQRAKALKKEFIVPGVRVYCEEGIAARAK